MKESTVISTGNMKIGKMPNVSLLPVVTCPKGVPCSKACYCTKAQRAYPSAQKKWNENTTLWQTNPVEFERQVMVYLEKKHATHFRWAVAGDIPDVNYLRMMFRVARRFPDTKFLAFTKQYELVIEHAEDVPSNLALIVSGWDGWKSSMFLMCAALFPVAQVHLKGRPTRRIQGIPVLECPGKCEPCGRRCWDMKKGSMVEFKEH